MSEVIDKFKEQYPVYKDVPDDQLALKLAEKAPQYLDADPGFKQQYHRAVAAGTTSGTGSTKVGPEEEASLRPATTYEKFRMSGLGRALLGRTAFEAEQTKSGVGPVEALTTSLAKMDMKPADIAEAARQFTAGQLGVEPDQLMKRPTDQSVAQSMHDHKAAALTMGVAKGLEDMDNFFTSPVGIATLGIGTLPKMAQRLVALGFSAQMASQVPELATQLGEEMGKPENERDYQKIGNLTTQAVATTGFSVAGVLHGVQAKGYKGEGFKAGVRADVAGLKTDLKSVVEGIRGTAPQTAEALSQVIQEGLDAGVGPKEKGAPDAIQRETKEAVQPVREQPAEGAGQVPTQGAGAEAGARGEPVVPKKTQAVLDHERYQDLLQEVKGKSMEEAAPLTQEIDQIKQRYGDMPPPEPEVITHAAWTDEEGNVHLGANHPEILEKRGVEGFKTRDSRNTPQFGFRTNRRRFISREEAGPVATEAGQNLETFEPGQKVHSDEVRSPVETDKALGDVPAQTPPVPEPEHIGMGGALAQGELADVGAGGEKYGISRRVRDERAKAGQVESVRPGRGANVDESIARGREIIEKDPGAAERFLRQFESDPDKKTWPDLFNATRAHGEKLAVIQRRIEERFGTDSPEFRRASDELSDWDKRTNDLGAPWSKSGVAMQAWTDLDTGSVGGLERERRRMTDKPFTPEDRQEAGKYAKEVREAENDTDKGAVAVHQELEKNSSPERQLDTARQDEADAIKTANEVADQVAKTEKDFKESTTQADRDAADNDEKRQKQALDTAQKAVERAEKKAEAAAKKVEGAKTPGQRKSLEGVAAAEQRALDAAHKVVREAAVRVAQAENKARVAKAATDRDVAIIHREAARRVEALAHKAVVDAAVRVARAEMTVEKRKQSAELAKAEQQALATAHKVVRDAAKTRLDAENKERLAKIERDQAIQAGHEAAARKVVEAAHKTVRGAAIREAAAENKARVAAAESKRKAAEAEAKAARKKEEEAWKDVVNAARKAAATERKMLADPSIQVWEKARAYLDKDIVNFADLKNKIASDLGLTPDRVARLLNYSKQMKALTDDLWLKQARERNAKTKAKLWVHGMDMGAWEKFWRSVPRKLFAVRVGFHGLVALGTHAPAVAFDPRFWGTYVRNFGQMYHMVASPTFFEAHMQDLLRRDTFATANRAGLVNNPYTHETFSYPGFSSELSEKVSKAMATSLGINTKWFTGMGERGYSILKVVRQDMFDQHWKSLPRQEQTHEVAEAIADAVNHITGVVKAGLGAVGPYAELGLFAPKLQMSRVMLLAGDPLRALETGRRMAVRAAGKAVGIPLHKLPEVRPAELWFAKNEIKKVGLIGGTLGGLLALNQGILSMSGSDQEVNWEHPLENDWLKFKVAGSTLSYGNPLVTMARLPMRLGTLAVGPGGKLRKLQYPDDDAAREVWEYFRSQLSPAASLAADLVMREDYQRRQLPFSERSEPKRLANKGIDPYEWNEYLLQQASMIPVQEFLRDTWQTGYGFKDEQTRKMFHSLLNTLFMAGTGARVTSDYKVDQPE